MKSLLILLDGQTTGGLGDYSGLIMIVALIAIFYFLMIRPQQKRQKEIKNFRERLTTGDRVVTAGGIYGKIQSIKDNTFVISIAPNVNITIDKGSVYPAAPAEGEAIQKQ